MQIKMLVQRKQTKKFLVRTDICIHLSIMIYYLIYLAWALAVRRDTQGNQWNVQTCFTVCNERMRRTDAMMRCHRRYAIAMAHLFSGICNKSGAWSSRRECLRSEETHRTPSYLPISKVVHSATISQSQHKIPIFLSSVQVIANGNLLKLCIIRQRFPALVCWKPKLHLDVSTTESEIQSLVEIGLSISFTASTSHLSSLAVKRDTQVWLDNFSTSEVEKVFPCQHFFNMFTSKCAFRHSGVQFFDIRTSKSAPNPTCFVDFHFQMCFSPQRRTIFRHLKLKKCSGVCIFLTCSLPNVLFATAAYNFSTSELQKVLPDPQFLTFWLPNVLFATAACIFWTSELQKVLRNWGVLYTFASKCAFHHSGMQFLIYPLTTWLRTRRFNRPTFRLTRHTNHWKNKAFRDVSNTWRGCVFFLLTFVLVHLLPSDLTACLIFFSTLHIVGSLLFKLHSTNKLLIFCLYVYIHICMYKCQCKKCMMLILWMFTISLYNRNSINNMIFTNVNVMNTRNTFNTVQNINST